MYEEAKAVCDDCGRIIDDKENAFCTRCYSEVCEEVIAAEKEIANLRDEIADLNRQIAELESEPKE